MILEQALLYRATIMESALLLASLEGDALFYELL